MFTGLHIELTLERLATQVTETRTSDFRRQYMGWHDFVMISCSSKMEMKGIGTKEENPFIPSNF